MAANHNTNATIDAHAYAAVSLQLLNHVLRYGDSMLSRNAIEQTIQQCVNDGKTGMTGGSPVITTAMPTAALPITQNP